MAFLGDHNCVPFPYMFLYNNLVMYIKVKIKGNGVFLDLCQWIEVKDIVRQILQRLDHGYRKL